jgi:hypothetical protein
LFGLNETELSTVGELWFKGATDTEVSRHFEGRVTSKQVSRIRVKLHLTYKDHPAMKTKFPNRAVKRYTPEQNADILARYRNGEGSTSIGKSYGVAACTIETKINRLLLRELEADEAKGKQLSEPTGRRCLTCGKWFMSIWPKSIHRRCCDLTG